MAMQRRMNKPHRVNCSVPLDWDRGIHSLRDINHFVQLGSTRLLYLTRFTTRGAHFGVLRCDFMTCGDHLNMVQ